VGALAFEKQVRKQRENFAGQPDLIAIPALVNPHTPKKGDLEVFHNQISLDGKEGLLPYKADGVELTNCPEISVIADAS